VEFTKTEKIDLGDIRVKNMARSTLTTRITALEAGEAFVVEGVEREVIMGRLAPLRKEGRSFATRKLAPMKFQIIRTA